MRRDGSGMKEPLTTGVDEVGDVWVKACEVHDGIYERAGFYESGTGSRGWPWTPSESGLHGVEAVILSSVMSLYFDCRWLP